VADLLAVREAGEAGSDRYPEPGEVRDSILLAHGDGLPTVHAVQQVEVRQLGLIRHRRLQQVSGVCTALIVTDSRTALASSEYGTDHAAGVDAMLVGHVRHAWLVEVAIARKAIRLAFEHPDGGAMALLVRLMDPDRTDAAGREIAARAAARSRRPTSGFLPRLREVEHRRHRRLVVATRRSGGTAL
jgi:hypothetical protein